MLEETAKYSKNNKKEEEGKYWFYLIFGFILGSILPITSLFLNSKSKSDSVEDLHYGLSFIFLLLSIPFIFYGLNKLTNNIYLYLLTLLFLVILFFVDIIFLLKNFVRISLPI